MTRMLALLLLAAAVEAGADAGRHAPELVTDEALGMLMNDGYSKTLVYVDMPLMDIRGPEWQPLAVKRMIRGKCQPAMRRSRLADHR